MNTYTVNEIFFSLQGEGVRAGTANLFLRFAGCNQMCTTETHGFDCDTDFASGRPLTLPEIVAELREAVEARDAPDRCPRPRSKNEPRASARAAFRAQARPLTTHDHLETGDAPKEADDARPRVGDAHPDCQWVILTGGEPALQVDRELIDGLHDAGYKLAIETNGCIELPDGLDWITVSPKVPEHEIRQRTANEVKYVRACGQGIPETVVKAEHHLISPAFKGDHLDQETLEWCIRLVKENPAWRLSVQLHKAWLIR